MKIMYKVQNFPKKNIADVADVSALCVISLCSFLFYLWKAIVIVYKSKIEEQ